MGVAQGHQHICAGIVSSVSHHYCVHLRLTYSFPGHYSKTLRLCSEVQMQLDRGSTCAVPFCSVGPTRRGSCKSTGNCVFLNFDNILLTSDYSVHAGKTAASGLIWPEESGQDYDQVEACMIEFMQRCFRTCISFQVCTTG